MGVLFVEDDIELAELVKSHLELNGFEVSLLHDGERVQEQLRQSMPELLLLDLNLPGVDGLRLCRRVRPFFSGAIVILTGRTGEADEIRGLELGADDYIAKPVRPPVLVARLRAALRSRRLDGLKDRLEVGPMVVDARQRSVSVRGQRLALTTAEFDVLWILAERAGQTVAREQMVTAMRGIEYDGLDRSIDIRVSRLRRKLSEGGAREIEVKSVRGVGYILAVGS